MGVLAVPQVFPLPVRLRHRPPRHRPASHVDRRQRPRNHPVVLGGVGERLLHQLETELQRRTAVALELGDETRVIGRIVDDEDVAEVLGRRAQQAGSADVDLLDEPVEAGGQVLRRLCEGIQVDDDQVDRLDALGANRLEIVRTMPSGEDAAEHRGVQGLDAAVHHLRKPGHVGDVDDGHAGGGNDLRGPSR